MGVPDAKHGHLPRLCRQAYCDRAMVHWIMTIQDRKTGWLDALRHAMVREIMLHTTILYRLLIPTYCAMPQHIHMLVLGIDEASDQLRAIAFFRRHFNGLVAGKLQYRMQKQAYDNVLREKDRERGAFQAIASYILDNPVREEFVEDASEWPYSGCMVPGHPAWDVFHPKYWDSFWKIYAERAR